nr:aminodeoxychorismate synthase component I [uncultured bacterium]
MRILIVDNYDSFTFNLVHYLTDITGMRPTVVKNDETTWEAIREDSYDAFVISPGPGHPARTRDLGLGAAILLEATVPVLGVCLGHQAIVQVYGGRVGRAPEPVHGRTSLVTHDQRGIFKGIPSPFHAVRYHSLLALHDVPACLRVTATTEPGLIMAVEHRARQLFGVQFHPESIQTEFGKLLLRNFVDIARCGKERSDPDVIEVPSSVSRRRRPSWRVSQRRVRTSMQPAAAFQRIFARASEAFWLDSSLVKPGSSRFSFMGDANGPGAFVLRYSLSGGAMLTCRGRTQAIPEDLFPFLRKTLDVDVNGADELPFDFCGGLIGYFGYELKSLTGGQTHHRSKLPDATWLFVDRFLAFDHETGDWYVVSVRPDGEISDETSRWVDEMAALLASPASADSTKPSQLTHALPYVLEANRDEYIDQIATAQQAIFEGETYEVCLTNRLRTAAADIDPLELYLTLRHVNPAPYAAYLNAGDFAVLSSSPERFLKVGADRIVESKPIKGTRRRVADPRADADLARELGESQKDRAENLMITDLVRNDLSRVCEAGSVWVPHLMHVESYETVHQLVSTIRGRLRVDCDVLDLVDAAFPPGSMTGAPKARTMEIIDGLEQSARGIYSGALGYLSLSGAADLSVVIRTIVHTDEVLEIGVGGAITALSDPQEEFDEMLLKGKAPCRAIALVREGRRRDCLRKPCDCDPPALGVEPAVTPEATPTGAGITTTRARESGSS